MRAPLRSSKATSPPRLLIFHARTGGLANRLRALVGYQALSRGLGVPFGLVWEVNRRCDTSFTDLFEQPDFELLPPAAMAELGQDADVEVHEPAIWFNAIWRQVGQGRVEQGDFVGHVKGCLDELTPLEEISDVVERFGDAHPLETMTGVHIRYTDNLQAFEHWATRPGPAFDYASVSTIEGFVAAMERRKARRFFLATDNPDVESMLAGRFGDRLIVFPKQYRNIVGRYGRTTSMPSALVDLLLLSRCREVIGTYYSSFSKLAAVIGGGAYYEIQGRRCIRARGVKSMQAGLAMHGSAR
jgi:hypothetical protein